MSHYVLVFRREPQGPDDPVKTPTALYIQNDEVATFNPGNALRFGSSTEAETYKTKHSGLEGFVPEMVHEDAVKIRTVTKAAFCGKWMEFWFKEEEDIPSLTPRSYDFCCKRYEFDERIESCGLAMRLLNGGVSGLKLHLKHDGHNWNIDFVEA